MTLSAEVNGHSLEQVNRFFPNITNKTRPITVTVLVIKQKLKRLHVRSDNKRTLNNEPPEAWSKPKDNCLNARTTTQRL